jgi:hypothetical protein
MKYMRKTAGYTGADYRTNTAIAKEWNIISVFGQNAGLQQKLSTARTENASWQITEDNNKTTFQKAVETRGDHWRDFWLCETGMGQQGAQLHDC